MRGKIILEEHVCMPEDNAAKMLALVSRNSKDLEEALLDLHHYRVDEMNENGVEHAIISQNPPGAQGVQDPKEAEAYATRSNNYVAQLVGKAPERFTAFAALSMHDPAQAVTELKRCVDELGMVGVLLNDAQEYLSQGQVKEHLYDEPQYDIFWSAVQELEVPIYLHPKGPLPQDFLRLYKTRPWLLGPTWSFARDTGFHALALCTNGVFDRFPRVRLILGHMGEMILGHIGRIDYWLEKRDRGRGLPSQQTIRTYFEKNIFITTAGYFSTPALIHAMTEISVDRILFSIDTPYANITEGAEWLDTASISRLDREKIGRGNALKLFPRLQRYLKSEEVESKQKSKEPVIFTKNKGFE